MKKNMGRGFTLIELLVVIAIIGLLSSIVLASLSTARTKGTAAKVQSQLASARSQAELYYSTTGANSYGPIVAKGTCVTSVANMFGTHTNSLATLLADVVTTVTAANTQCAIGNTAEVTAVSTAAKSWAASAQDPSTAGTYYCVDSSGASIRKAAASAAASITVDATSAHCS